MQEPREGGCLCGAVRYRVTNAPFRTSVCHCTFCQRRTGSAFGLGAYFKKDDFELLSGELRSYEHRSDESGRWLRLEFCPNCGTTVTWTLKSSPRAAGSRAAASTTSSWLRIDRHSWTRSKHHWFVVPPGVETIEQSALPPPNLNR